MITDPRRTDPLLRRLQHPRRARPTIPSTCDWPPTSGGPACCKGSSGTGTRSSRRGSTGAPPTWTTTDRPGCNGRAYFVPCLQSHHPLDAVVVMLGTNDLKTCFDRTADADRRRAARLPRRHRRRTSPTAAVGPRPWCWSARSGSTTPRRSYREMTAESFDSTGVARSRGAGPAMPPGRLGTGRHRTSTRPRSLAPATTASTSPGTPTVGWRSSSPTRSAASCAGRTKIDRSAGVARQVVRQRLGRSHCLGGGTETRYGRYRSIWAGSGWG